MSDHLHYFQTPAGCTAVVLPFELEEMISWWSALRTRMIRRTSPAFTRDEWAYLLTFLDPAHLRTTFTQAFGAPVAELESNVTWVVRPRGLVAVWLPNNVSLLGPLTTILLSLTGNPVQAKGGSRSEDLVGAFLDYVRQQAPACAMTDYFLQAVRREVFDRHDPRNAQLAEKARMRIVFGSDDAASSIHALPHPLDSIGISFSNRRSEVWIEAGATDDAVLSALIKVFAIYGQAGCTSPARLVLLDQPRSAAVRLRERLCDLWPAVIPRDVAPHLASGNVMARQWAAALGWDAVLVAGSRAVLAIGNYDLEPVASPLLLPIIAAPLQDAITHLPVNIQTLGHAVTKPQDQRWLTLLAHTKIERFVPLQHMHHFGGVWDGETFWRQAFETVQVGDSSTKRRGEHQ